MRGTSNGSPPAATSSGHWTRSIGQYRACRSVIPQASERQCRTCGFTKPGYRRRSVPSDGAGMIEGLERVLDGSGQPGVTELRSLLEALLGGREAEGRLIEQQTLQPRALRLFRLRFALNGR